jgi:L-fuconolactonase
MMDFQPGRRAFVAAMAGAPFAGKSAWAAADIPIIDTHVHLFDPRRPQGVPYSGPKGQPPQLALPDIYRGLARPTGIVGAIVVEASPWIEDNLWILERAESDLLFVGVVGNLQPDKPDFPELLERFAKNPLWRGIRFGHVWTMDQGKQVLKPGILEGLTLLAKANLSLDMANPSIELLYGALLVAQAIPALRIVIDHMPQFDPTPETQSKYDELIDAMSKHPNLFIKLSQVIHPNSNGLIAQDLATYRARLDRLLAAFGEDRIMFGSNWPETVGKATIAQSVSLMQSYFSDKPREQMEKYFWRNSEQIYKWIRRDPAQPG